MKLKQKLYIFIISSLVLFGVLIVVYANNVSVKVNEKWGKRFVKQQLIFDKSKTLLPIMDEVALVRQLSQEKSIIDMALNENNKEAYKNGLATLERYRQKFHSKSYFIAFSKTGHYYYNDAKNRYKGKELVHTLNKSDKNDEWFYTTIKQKKDFNINIDKDIHVGVTNIWINYQIKYKSKVIGVVGTGFELSNFLKNFVDTEQEDVYNIFVDENLAIELIRDSKFIDYASITNFKNKTTNINTFIKNKEDILQLKKVIVELKNAKNANEVRTLWLNFRGEEYLVGVSYIKELGWFNLTAINAVTISAINGKEIYYVFIFLMTFGLIMVGLFINFQIIKPIDKLKYDMEDIEKNGYKKHIKSIEGNDEIALLSKQFQRLLKIIAQHSEHLERIVQERTNELYEKQQFLNNILDNVEAYIFIKDLNHHYTYVNKAMQEAMQEPLEKIIGQDISTLYDEKTVDFIKKTDDKILVDGKKTVSEEKIHKDGLGTFYILVKKVPLYDKNGKIYALLGVSTDITERKKHEKMIKEMAYYDILTKLPNRRLLEDRLKQMLAKVKREKKHGGVMFLDMDNFKNINDTYGHDVGDMLLIEASKRYLSVIRKSDTVARLGGDEFVVAIGELNDNEELAKKEILEIADKILKIANEKYIIELVKDDGSKKHIEFECTSSIGITIFNSNDTSIEAILKRADKAMYEVKNTHKNGIYMWEQE